VVTEAARPDEQRSRAGLDRGESEGTHRGWRRWLAYLPLLVAAGAIATLLVYADPHKIGIAFQRFNLVYIPVVVVLAVGFYLVQGVRWWTLNRALGIKFPLLDTVFLTETGQATALLPLGELTRALLLSKAAAVNLGAVVASETVQELLFVFMLFVLALPKALSLHLVAIAVVVPMIFVVVIVAILTVEGLYAWVRRIIGRVPVLKRLRPAVDELHRDTRVLFRHVDTYRYLPLSAAQAVMAVSLLWAVAQAVDPGKLSWTSAGFVYAVTQGAAWLSLMPGGLGAVEASTAGLLVLLGISFDIATAISVIQRLADKGLNTVFGWVCYLFARRRYNLTGASLFRFEMPRAEEAVAARPS
jgi:glycosyltransferase 2 family protein